MRAQITLNTASAGHWSYCNRTRHYSNAAFRYARFVIPTFYQTGTAPIADIDLPYNYTYQIGVEYPFTNSLSGIPAGRSLVTFNSANTVTYTSGSGPEGYILSDVFDFGQIVPAGTFFGLWTVIENPSQSGTITLPTTFVASNNYQSGWQRYQGTAGVTTSSNISAGTAANATSITSFSSVQTGSGGVVSPCMMLIQVPSETRSIFSVGDCIGFSIAEGQTGSSTYGDCMGSTLGNAGFMDRYVFETLSHNSVNICRGADAFKYYSATNWQYRLQLLALANPTHVFCQYGHNDISGGITLSALLADAQAMYAGMQTATGGVPIIQMCQTPASTSTDNFATIVNQTAESPGFGGSSSVRGQFNDTYIRTNGSALGNVGYVDPNVALEYGYTEGTPSSETSLNNVTGNANGYTLDGTHMNSYGHSVAASNMIAYRNGIQVSDPFAT